MTNWVLCAGAIFFLTIGNGTLASLFNIGWLASMIYDTEEQQERKRARRGTKDVI